MDSRDSRKGGSRDHRYHSEQKQGRRDQSPSRRRDERTSSRPDGHRDRNQHRDNYDNYRHDDRRDDRRREAASGASSDSRVKQEHGSNRNQSSYPERTHFKREHSRSPDTKASRNRKRTAHEEDTGQYEWGKDGGHGGSSRDKDNKNVVVEKEKPNFGLSGKLTEDTNKVNGVVIKYAEPPDARKPKRRWRLYPFKGDQALPTLFIHRQSCYLIGRDRKICDLPVDHPSCSKQHAVIQYRLVPYTKDDGTKSQRVRPYVLDLESANGTFVNNKQIEAKKYIELLEKDVVKFGFSSREYVVLHENSKDEELDDDIDIGAEEEHQQQQEQQRSPTADRESKPKRR